MSATLAAQQTSLLDALYLNTPDFIANYEAPMRASGHFFFKNASSATRGLRAYRANAQALAVSALQSCYPTVQQLLGEENFSHLAQDFWQAMPPERGDLAQWGHALQAYLPRVPQLQALLAEHAYLQDVARLEWALHEAASASDAAVDAESFQRLATEDPAQLCLQLSPGCALLQSAFPVVAIVQLHDARSADAHDAAREAIASQAPQAALIWRQGFRPMLSAVDAPHAALIAASLQGQSFAAALDAAFAQSPDFDLSAWLASSVQAGLLLGVVWI